jgi:hypothetical protein
MLEQFIAHVAFHPGAHDMPLEVDKHGAQRIGTNQRQHERSHQIDVVKRMRHVAFQDVAGDVARAQGKCQRYRRYN